MEMNSSSSEQRLLEKAYNFNLVDEKRYKDFFKKEEEYKKFIKTSSKKENNLIYKQTNKK